MSLATQVWADGTSKDGIPVLRVRSHGSPELVDVRVATAGVIAQKREHIHHRFGFYAVSLIAAGEGTFQLGAGRVQPVRAGSCFVEYPGPLFRYGPRDQGTWDEYSVVFFGPGVERWKAQGLLPCDGRVREVANVREHIQRYRTIRKLVTRRAPRDLDRAAVELERLLLELYDARLDRAQRRAEGHDLGAVLEYLAEHRDAEVDFEGVAARFDMSYSSLRQKLRRATGMSPARYALLLRCDAAKRLLTSSSLTVKEISQRLGWTDPYTMSRAFKRGVGVSPERYRREAMPWT